ncbi:maestro heat-like repeat-containing protein family member 1 [Eurytemora carolleeae]|uniref:maestro heat-like repeat-containing protein family member 1 n=1 Tax=Eurytemora carolleeae TaxID=1294199 RepID=UPI000C757611|nr:maestro heat-like repeat-containing protein family member 1 [Eurytemora carolleeae]|eukprot:XP_023324699.1 maestro heat-like repeat-containing protein family member 1 [Eurytemora affinis]
MSRTSSPKGSEASSEDGINPDLKIKTVIHSLLETCRADEQEVRQAASHSLSLVGRHYPLLVLQEWFSEYSKEKQTLSPSSPISGRRPSVSPSQVQPFGRLTSALQPVITVLVKHSSLDPGDVRHRAILGQIMAVVVDEMLRGSAKGSHLDSILVDLGGTYMDKVMDVLLVHFQPNNTGSLINPLVVECLASLAYRHPTQCVPFLKAILSTTAHVMKSTKLPEVALRTEICKAICRFSEAILDYVSNINEMPDTSVTTAHFQTEGDTIYDTLYTTWLSTAKETKMKTLILESMAACTPFLSRDNVLDHGVTMILALLALYKRLGSVANLEITVCASQLIDMMTSASPAVLETILDPILQAMFIQVCIPADYTSHSILKNHHEAIRSFDTLMKYYPEKVVSGLLLKFDNSDDKSRVGALTVVKHILNLPTKTLNYRLDEITRAIHQNLGEQNSSVRRLIAQIIVVLGDHGCLSGESGKDFIDFIVKMCEEGDRGTEFSSTAPEPLAIMGDNILQLLTNSVVGVEPVLWPYLLEYLMQDTSTLAVSAVSKSLAVLSIKKQAAEDPEFSVKFENLQYCTSPVVLFSRLLVLASNPQVNGRGINILKFLKSFAPNIHFGLKELWDSRFPLLLHYLDQHEPVDLHQWHNWLLDLLTDSLVKMEDQDWCMKMGNCLVHQFNMYENSSIEKSFAIKSVGKVLVQIQSNEVILNHLSSLFLAALEPGVQEESCGIAFGSTASTHLNLVMDKLDTLYKSQVKKKSTTFFGLLRDKAGEQTQSRSLAIILHSVGQAAKNAPTPELERFAEKMIKDFLAPALFTCRESEKIQESVLASVSEVATAFHSVHKHNPYFVMPQQEEILSSVIAVLQDNLISLKSKQMALIAITNLIQLPPVISQLTRCSLLKASFNTLFNSFLEADCFKHEDYKVASELEKKLTSIADSLHILIQKLLKQDMEQSTVDEIFTMLETWLRLDQPLSRELSVNILQGALDVYAKNVKLGVGSPTNFTPGPYMIGAMVARCHDPSLTVRRTALACLQTLLRILGVYEGLSPETVENSLEQLNTMNVRCNNLEMTGKIDRGAISDALVNVLNERIQHNHILTLLDSLVDGLLDSQLTSVSGCISVFEGLVSVRGSEVFQNVPGLASKLHFKMTMMAVDETSDLMAKVAVNIRYLAVHNCRGVVSSLLRAEMPFDQSAKLIWTSLTEGIKLSTDVLDLLLETSGDHPVRQTVHGTYLAEPLAVSSISALTIMLDSHKLEVICREEFGKIFSHLIVVSSHFVNARFERKRSDAGVVSTISPFIIALEALRSLFSSINCLVVSHSITADQTHADLQTLRAVLGRMVRSVVIHAPHLLQLMVSSLLPFSYGSSPDCVREASISVLRCISLEKAGGDMVLLSSVISALLKGISDPAGKVRELVLEGLVGVEHCTVADIDTLAEALVAGYVQGIEDEKSSDVALVALKGLCRILPVLPAHYVHNSIDLISLKVRPYFEMAGNEHRAAAVQLYKTLAKFAEGSFRTIYLDHCQSILGPVLLYSTSSHKETSKACLATLEVILEAAKEPDLAYQINSFNIIKGFDQLMDKIIGCSSTEINSMLESLIGQCLGYFRSSNPNLRRNAVILLSKVLCKPGLIPGDKDGFDEELITGVLGGTLDLLKDPDIEVRKTAALYIGDLVTLQANQS